MERPSRLLELREPVTQRHMSETIAARKASTRGIVLLIVVVLAWGTMWPVNKALLAYTSVLWAPLFAALFLRERLSLRRALGLGLGVLGLIVIFNPATFDWSDRGAVAGNAALLLAAMLWAASIVHNRGHVWRSTPFQLAPWQALLSAVILILVAAVFEGPPAVQWNAHSALLLLFAGIPGTALAYWAAAVSSSELPASTTSLGLMVTPAVSIVIAMAMLGEQPTVALIAALALILIGVVVGMSGGVGAPRR